jgi:HlyD family secretion protein
MQANNAGKEITAVLGIDQNRPRQKRRSRGWVLAAVVVALGLAALAVVPKDMGGHSRQPLDYKTEPVVRGDLTVLVTATGNLAPTNTVEVGSELSGIVQSVEVDFNDRVKVGQPLARLDNTKFEAAAMESKAALASAEAKALQAKATLMLKGQNLTRLQKAHKLSGGKAPSLGELEIAEADLSRAKADANAAQAAIQQAHARLKIDETNLANTIIYSPVNGIILTRKVDPGQTVAAALQAPVLFTLAEDLTKMKLQVDVDEADVGIVREGQNATFTVEAYPGRTFDARIAQLRYGSQVTNGVVTYTTLLYVDNSDLLLRPGMTATAKIVAKRIADQILIPNAALRFTPKEEVQESGQRRGLYTMLFKRANSAQSQVSVGKIAHTRVWVLENRQLIPFVVSTGQTDGILTVIKESELSPGMQVVVDVAQAG